MKNLLKFTFVLFVIGGMSNTAFGQLITETADVNVTAEVAVAITLTPTNIALGTIISDLPSVIDANSNDGATEANLGNTNNAGSLVITGTAGQSVNVNYNGTAVLSRVGGTGAGGDLADFTVVVKEESTNTDYVSDTPLVLTGGTRTLTVGGSLDAVLAANAGTFNTTTAGGVAITFVVNYL